LNKFNFSNGNFSFDSILKITKEKNIDGIFADANNILWINSENGIFRYDLSSKKFNFYEHYNDFFGHYCSSCFYPIGKLTINQLLLASKDGLFIFNTRSETFVRFAHKYKDNNSLVSNNVLSFYKINSDSVLLGTSQGLSLFLVRKKKFINFTYKDTSLKTTKFRNVINSIAKDPQGFYWLGTKKGLLLFNLAKKQISDVPDKLHSLKQIQQSSITKMLIDNSKALWVGTTDNFLFKISRKKLMFNKLSDVTNKKIKNTRAIYIDKNKRLWIGTNTDGVYIFDKNHKLLKNLTPNNSKLKSYYILCFYKYSENKLAIGTNTGLYIVDLQTLETKFIYDIFKNLQKNPFLENVVFDIVKDNKNNLWLATINGLLKINPFGKLTIYRKQDNTNSLSSNTCYKIFIDNKDNIWVGTLKGLNKLVDEKKGIFNHYFEGKEKWGLPGNSVLNITQDTARNLYWISTENGLAGLNENKGVIHKFTTQNGLVNDYIYATIVSDKNLWLMTNKGITRLDSDFHAYFFDKSNGLSNYEFNLGAYFVSDSSYIYMAGNNGINFFNPENVHLDKWIPKVRINSVLLTQKGSQKEILFPQDKEYIFFYKALHIHFSFILPDYNTIGKSYFKYRLIGFDNNWNYLGTKHSISFSQLPIGHYILQLQGANNQGVWGEKITEFHFYIKPAFYNSTFAFLIYFFIIVLLIIAAILFITRRLRKENTLLRQKEKDAIKIGKQREQLMLQNKNIQDSMVYAKRIIDALMPTIENVKKIFPDSFIIHQPKEIVSGDFFWSIQIGKFKIIAAVDCTGHGVSGAFMSIIGVELLQTLVKKQKITNPSQILQQLSINITDILSKEEGVHKALADGMDIALCVYNEKEENLYFSGAFNPLYLIRNNSLIEFKADRMSVGSGAIEHNYTFTNKIIKVKPNDTFYIFSDGYTDQFGGPNGKKFKYRRFRHMLLNIHKHHVDVQKEALLKTFTDWSKNEEQVDDVLVIGFRPYHKKTLR